MNRSLAALLASTMLIAPALVAQQPPQGPPAGFADAVIGRWDLTVQGASAPYPSWVHIQLRKETELQGRFVGQFGSVRNLTKVEYRDGALAFEVPVQYEQNKSDLRFEGRLTGDTLEGTTVAANGTTLKWTGKRAPALAGSRWDPLESTCRHASLSIL